MLEGAIEYYISTVKKNPVTLGLRFGGAYGHGDIPFYKMPNLGGTNGLRGYIGQRFTGDSKMFFNSEFGIGCPALCEIRQYDIKPFSMVESFSLDYINYTRNYSVLFLSFKSNEINIEKEKQSYDFNNFVGEIGGSLGFFMGASAFTFFNYFKGLIFKRSKSSIKPAK